MSNWIFIPGLAESAVAKSFPMTISKGFICASKAWLVGWDSMASMNTGRLEVPRSTPLVRVNGNI